VPLSHVYFGAWSAVGIGGAVALATVLAALVFITRANRVLHITLREYITAVVTPGLLPYAAALAAFTPWASVVVHAPRLVGVAILCGAGCFYGALLAFCLYHFVLTREEQVWLASLVRQPLAVYWLKRRTVAA
jgi:hypothetical protein